MQKDFHTNTSGSLNESQIGVLNDFIHWLPDGFNQTNKIKCLVTDLLRLELAAVKETMTVDE